MSTVLLLIGSSIGPAVAGIYMQSHQEVVANGVNNRMSGSSFPSPISYNLIFVTAALVSATFIAFAIILKRKILNNLVRL